MWRVLLVGSNVVRTFLLGPVSHLMRMILNDFNQKETFDNFDI